jgi:hypothetical protein
VDLEKRWGRQYLLDQEKIEKDFLAVRAASSEIPLSTVTPKVSPMGNFEYQFRKILRNSKERWRALTKSRKAK